MSPKIGYNLFKMKIDFLDGIKIYKKPADSSTWELAGYNIEDEYLTIEGDSNTLYDGKIGDTTSSEYMISAATVNAETNYKYVEYSGETFTLTVSTRFKRTVFSPSSMRLSADTCNIFDGDTVNESYLSSDYFVASTNGSDFISITCDETTLNASGATYSIIVQPNTTESRRNGSITFSFMGESESINIVQGVNKNKVTYSLFTNASDDAIVSFKNGETVLSTVNPINGYASYTTKEIGSLERLTVTIMSGLPDSVSDSYEITADAGQEAYTASSTGASYTGPTNIQASCKNYTYSYPISSTTVQRNSSATLNYSENIETTALELYAKSNKSWIVVNSYNSVTIATNSTQLLRTGIITYYINEASTTYSVTVTQTYGAYEFNYNGETALTFDSDYSGKTITLNTADVTSVFNSTVATYYISKIKDTNSIISDFSIGTSLITIKVSKNSDFISKTATLYLVQNNTNAIISIDITIGIVQPQLGDVYCYNFQGSYYSSKNIITDGTSAISDTDAPIGIFFMGSNALSTTSLASDDKSNPAYARVIALNDLYNTVENSYTFPFVLLGYVNNNLSIPTNIPHAVNGDVYATQDDTLDNWGKYTHHGKGGQAYFAAYTSTSAAHPSYSYSSYAYNNINYTFGNGLKITKLAYNGEIYGREFCSEVLKNFNSINPNVISKSGTLLATCDFSGFANTLEQYNATINVYSGFNPYLGLYNYITEGTSVGEWYLGGIGEMAALANAYPYVYKSLTLLREMSKYSSSVSLFYENSSDGCSNSYMSSTYRFYKNSNDKGIFSINFGIGSIDWWLEHEYTHLRPMLLVDSNGESKKWK